MRGFNEMITPKQFTNGQVIVMDGELCVVLYTQHKRTAQRGAVVRTKVRNVKTGAVNELNLDPDTNYEKAYIDKKALLYLYHDDETYHFMDQGTYEQYELRKDLLGDSVNFLKENTEITVDFYEGKPFGLELPIFIDLKVTYTEPGIKGDTARGGGKPATLETGATVKVPLFVEQGNVIRIDTRTGEYTGRV
ncbi:MAG: elongation factor P [Candidatus Omnitrophota bacterium]